jgi:hypothetical protein
MSKISVDYLGISRKLSHQKLECSTLVRAFPSEGTKQGLWKSVNISGKKSQYMPEVCILYIFILHITYYTYISHLPS